MKIVDVAEFYSPLGGGVRTYVDHKLALARRFGHRVTILAPGPSTTRERRHGGEIQWLESPVNGSITAITGSATCRRCGGDSTGRCPMWWKHRPCGPERGR